MDVDASAIHAKKKGTKRTYKNHCGYMPILAHVGKTEQVVACEFRDGNVPPTADNFKFMQSCMQALPEGVSVGKFRADAAATKRASSITALNSVSSLRYASRWTRPLRTVVAEIPEVDWMLVVNQDGKVSDIEFTARTVHVMNDTPEAFCVVVQKTMCKENSACEPADDETAYPQQVEMKMKDCSLFELDQETALDQNYVYRAIAANLDQDDHDNVFIVWWYNQRADASENRIKELCRDFAGAHLPCSLFHANEAYLLLSAIAYNLLTFMCIAVCPS